MCLILLLTRFYRQIGSSVTQSEIPKGRRVLTAQQAIKIFRLRDTPSMQSQHQPPSYKRQSKSVALSRHYGVSPKTIRDIWNRRTWAFATLQVRAKHQSKILVFGRCWAAIWFWFLSQAGDHQYCERKAGRPKGSRDKKPRVRKSLPSPGHAVHSFMQESLVAAYVPDFHPQPQTGRLATIRQDELASGRNEGICQGLHFNCAPESYFPDQALHGVFRHDVILQRPCAAWLDRSIDESLALSDPFHDDWPFLGGVDSMWWAAVSTSK